MKERGLSTLSVVDLTKEQPDPPDFDPPHHKIVYNPLVRRKTVLQRSLSTIDGIVLHQTGTPFGTSAAQVKDAGGDVVLAKHRRALNVSAHMTAFDTGFAVLAHPLDWYVYHGNSLNARSIGIEIEGLFPQLTGKKEQLTGKLLTAAQDGIEYVVREGRRRGMPLRFVWAHRQASMTRDDDPGQEIWQKLALGFCASLGLHPQHDLVMGGKVVPDAWRKKARVP